MRVKKLGETAVRAGHRYLSHLVLALGRFLYGLQIEGPEHLPSKGPLIIVGRHSSRVDFFGAAFFFSAISEINFLTAGLTITSSRLLVWSARSLGAFPLFKEKGLTAAPLMELYRALKQGKVVCLTDNEIAWDGRLQPPRPGAAWLALRTHAPLVVGWLQGGYDIWPRWAQRPRLRGKLILRIGKPFYLCDAPCERVTEEMLQEANRRIRAEIERLSDHSLTSRENVQ